MAAAQKFDINNPKSIEAFIRRTNAKIENIAKTFGTKSEYYEQYTTHLRAFFNPKGTLHRTGETKKTVTYTDSQGKSKQVQIIQLKRETGKKGNINDIYNQRNDPVRAKAFTDIARDVDKLPGVSKILSEGRKKLKADPKNKNKKQAELNKLVQAEIERRRQLDKLINDVLNELYDLMRSAGLDIDSHQIFTDYFGRRNTYQATQEKEEILDKIKKEIERLKTGGGSQSGDNGNSGNSGNSGLTLDEWEELYDGGTTYFDTDEFVEIIGTDDNSY